MLKKRIPLNEPLIVRLSREYREALDAKLDAQVYTMVEHWHEAEGHIESHIQALLFEIGTRADGESIAQINAYRELARYKELRAEVQREIAKYDNYAYKLINEGRMELASKGVSDAVNIIAAGQRYKIGKAFNILPRGAIENLAGALEKDHPLGMLLSSSFPETWKEMAQTLVNGMTEGRPIKEVAREMMDNYGIGLQRATTIARTEELRAYREASVQQYRTSDMVKGYRRLVAKDGACLACLVSDGEYFEAEEDFTDHPNGRCTCVAVLEGVSEPVWERGTDWLERQDEEKQVEIMGESYYELWKSGKVELEDLRATEHSEIWGDSPKVAPISSLKE